MVCLCWFQSRFAASNITPLRKLATLRAGSDIMCCDPLMMSAGVVGSSSSPLDLNPTSCESEALGSLLPCVLSCFGLEKDIAWLGLPTQSLMETPGRNAFSGRLFVSRRMPYIRQTTLRLNTHTDLCFSCTLSDSQKVLEMRIYNYLSPPHLFYFM